MKRAGHDKVDCGTYIEKYLSAQVDGELSAAELRGAEEHLARCVHCRARFAEERAVKAMLRESATMHGTPPMVRGSILAAL
ncbi:MAG: zf-HC2 domain-containing protein, partial [Candidatus Binatus sp.]